jgi:hypothetical protein
MKYASAIVASLFAAAACLAGSVDDTPRATRVIEGTKSTFPEKSIPEGVKALTAVLESCHNISDGTVRYTADDVKKAQKGDHVRFVLPKPVKVEILGKQLDVTEAVFADGVFWLGCGKDVVRCAKYTHDKMERFREWYRQLLPAD